MNVYRIQLGFVYQKQGRIKEAHQLYLSNLKAKLDDIALMAVASNNVVCINKDQNLFDSKKKMKVALNEALLYKLPSKQRRSIALNNAIFNYYINQTDQCEKVCKNIEETWPQLTVHTTIIRALNLVKSGSMKEAIELLKKCSTKNDKLYINLCIAQLHLIQVDYLYLYIFIRIKIINKILKMLTTFFYRVKSLRLVKFWKISEKTAINRE